MKNKKLKICFMGDARLFHLQFWAQELTKLGHEVHVITHERGEIEGIKVHSTKTKYNKYLNFFLTYFKLRKIIRKINPDIIHAHFLGSFTFLGLLTGLRPFIGTVWGSDVRKPTKKNMILNFMFRYALKKSDFIYVSEKTTKNFLMKNHNLDGKKIDFPYWGINTNLFKPIKCEKKFDLIYLRTFSKYYSTTVLIEALNIVRKKYPKIKALIKKDPGYLECENLIKKYKLENNIKRFEWIPHEEIPKKVNSSLIYVDTFQREYPSANMGIITFESMSCGLPIIQADNPGVKNYINHNKNGLIYKRGDHKELAEHIIKLLENKKLREKLGANARKTIIKDFNWDLILKKTERKYFELVEKYK